MKSTAPPPRRSLSLVSTLAGLLALGLLAPPAAAQPLAPQPAPPPPAGAQPSLQPAPPAAVQPAAPKVDPLAVALAPQPGGLTPEEVAKATLRTRASLRVKQAELRAAAARVDQALVNFFPRLTVTATYTRLSPTDAPSLGPPTSSVVTTTNPDTLDLGNLQPVRVRPCPDDPAQQCVANSLEVPNPLSNLDFSPPPNSYSLTANLAVPISDYVLRISQGYASASHAESAKKLELQAETLQAAADAKVAFFNWIRVKGQVVVAGEAVSQARAHVEDARRNFQVGRLSRADVLRLEAQVASAEQLLSEAQAALLVADDQIRIALGAAPDRPLTLGIDVMGSAPSRPPAEALPALYQEALQRRLEIRALDETQYSLEKAEAVTRAGYFPRVDAFADLTYANPNQRIFPQRDQFDLTWAAGVRASWVLNDVFTTAAASAEASARTAQIVEQKAALRDALRLEVASSYADLNKATSSIESAERQLAAAAEVMRVRSELFRVGQGTSVDLVDAETEVTRARLQQLNARVGALVARTRLDHAVGRDANDVK
ncbi:outer membrane efflux protein [Sorangium cellulosum]|uniref:Outer membrane efflux protein n=1 Tax=Sorangium cellulosum TaxID=56 RepID=A0A2L0ERU4_SORCE|nr:TolC family protein [Sorangium cellulosum]AUX42004.1 outer membrane efflux protein [Sorangium cellulosum]